MSIHLEAEKGQIAETVLLPGDPLRAKFIAENFLENAVCYNRVRNMFGYTGTYKGKKVSVQGSGMGIPSISIYVHELICNYDVKNLIRVGTCGALQKDISLKEVIIATAASTDSSYNKIKFNQMDYAPAASFELLSKAVEVSRQHHAQTHVGTVLSSDFFYKDDGDEDTMKIWRDYGVLAVEMETSALYTLAARFNKDALSLLTVSDNLFTGERTSSEEREKSFRAMMEIALEIC